MFVLSLQLDIVQFCAATGRRQNVWHDVAEPIKFQDTRTRGQTKCWSSIMPEEYVIVYNPLVVSAYNFNKFNEAEICLNKSQTRN